MKKIIFLALLSIITNLSSQNSIDCNSNLSIFAEYYKVKNYDAAYEPWMSVRKECPKLNPAIYFQGSRMLEEFIKKSDGESKIAFQDDLIKLYDEWLINFPAYRGRSIVGQIMSNKNTHLFNIHSQCIDCIMYLPQGQRPSGCDSL